MKYLIELHLQIVRIASVREQRLLEALDGSLLEAVLRSWWELNTGNINKRDGNILENA